MMERWFTPPIRQMYYWLLKQRLGNREMMPLDQPAMVFAPHPDDETLGCGGTILLKQQAGAQVKIAFMTDGSGSHAQFLPASELAANRRQEAIAAAACMGLHADDLTFFDFRDGELASACEQAIACVVALLQRYQPAEVYLPYRSDPPPDHQATHRIVMTALAEWQQKVTVYEYPVWFWHHWPWVRLQQEALRETRRVVKNTLQARIGLTVLRDFRHAVPIETVLEKKLAALRQHQTQMVRPDSNLSWPILADVSGGDFLNCFFQKQEVFHRYVMYPARRTESEKGLR